MMEAASSGTPESTPSRHLTWGNGSCSPPPPPHAQRSTQGDAQLTAVSRTGLSVENGGGCVGSAPLSCTHAPPRAHTLPPSCHWQGFKKWLGGPRTSGTEANGAGTGRQEPPKAAHVFFLSWTDPLHGMRAGLARLKTVHPIQAGSLASPPTPCPIPCLTPKVTPSDFIVTASVDGCLKFWKKQQVGS